MLKHGIKCSYWEKPADTPETYFVDKAALLGFDGVELESRMVMDKTPDQLRELGSYARQKGIALTLGSGPPKHLNLCAADAGIRADAVRYRTKLIQNSLIFNA